MEKTLCIYIYIERDRDIKIDPYTYRYGPDKDIDCIDIKLNIKKRETLAIFWGLCLKDHQVAREGTLIVFMCHFCVCVSLRVCLRFSTCYAPMKMCLVNSHSSSARKP